MCDNAISLTLVAAELNLGTHELKRRANGHLVRDDAGMTCLTKDFVRELVLERDAKDAAFRETQKRNRENVAKATKAARASVRKGRPATTGNAFLDIRGEEEYEDQAAKSPTSDYLRGGDPVYHSISERG